MYRLQIFLLIILSSIFSITHSSAQQAPQTHLIAVGEGWAKNSINAVVFRKNSLVSIKDTQFIAYYNEDGFIVLGKRKLGTENWQLKTTELKANTADAHNTIAIMLDGDGYLHLSWDHHNNQLRYCKSVAPLSLKLTPKMQMTGVNEKRVTYPEFYRLANGNLLFFYRNGESGEGNLVLNHYDLATKTWTQLHSNLIDGEQTRNAYWQACTDSKGVIHISWVWRETGDVASNHDLCYARSKDGGKTWEKSNGEKYKLPITAASAEYAFHIPQKSELINQTSMTADENGNPFIATYWRERGDSIPQYHLVYKTKRGWVKKGLNFRSTPFSLSGGGTKRIPISRPQILVKGAGKKAAALLIFRDEERNSKASVVKLSNVKKNKWQVFDLTDFSVGSWEPSFDTELWKAKKQLNLFIQKVDQVDGEGKSKMPAQPVQVLEWQPHF